MMTHRFAAGLASILVLATAVQAQSVIYVDYSADQTPHDGTSWASAFVTLQEALDAVQAGDEIRVADGTYYPTLRSEPDVGRTETFQLISGVTIKGGYAGDGAADPDARDIDLYETILSGDIGVPGDEQDNCYHVVTGSGVDATAVLDGFTVTGGRTNRFSGGGGLYIEEGSPTIIACAFRGNWASTGAGGACSFDGAPTFTRCVFEENSGFYGGGLSASGGSLTLTDCTFARNFSGYRGGALFVDGGATLIRCLFYANSAVRSGGGAIIESEEQACVLRNCAFVANSANTGGGIQTSSSLSTVTLTNCTLVANVAEVGGGVSGSSTVSLMNCIVWDNGASPVVGDNVSVAFSCIEGGWEGEGNIDADPLFVDADGADDVFGTDDDDLHLQEGSPCVNTGDNKPLHGFVDVDFEGDPRIQNCRADMGVDETPYYRDANENGVVDACEGWARGVVYVDPGAVGGSGDGMSWANAFLDIQEALFQARRTGEVTEIRIAQGVYMPGQLVDDAFAPVDGVPLLGGYAGLGAVDPDARDIALYETVLSGDIGVVGDSADNCGYVVTVGDGVTAILGGVTITGAVTTGAWFDEGSVAVLTDCTFRANSGRGLRAYLAKAGLTRCVFQQNASVGALFSNSEVTLTGCDFISNSGSYGGGMASFSGRATLTDCVFLENVASHDGGGLYDERSELTLSNCEFLGNVSSVYGGGLYSDSMVGELVATNCIFSGNSAACGGGWSRTGNRSSLTNCSFTANSAAEGSALCDVTDRGLVVQNCIVWNNPSSRSPIEWYDAVVTHSCIEGGWEGEGNIDVDPLFVDADGADDIPGTLDDDLRLQAGSPCIDAGDNAAIALVGLTDLDGHYRRFDDPATVDTGAGVAPIIDMGAYEYGSTQPPLYGDLNCDGAVNAFDIDPFVAALVDAVTYAAAYPQCEHGLADCNGDGAVNAFDIDPFVMILVGG